MICSKFENGKPTSRLDSYRPILLLICESKFPERLILHRLTWHLEYNFTPELIGFRAHLAA